MTWTEFDEEEFKTAVENEIKEMKDTIDKMNVEIACKDAEIAAIKADKDAEITKLKELLAKNNIQIS